MKKPKPLIVKDKVVGLRPYCSHCNREIGNRTCGLTGKSLNTCKHTDQHTFKAFITIPGSNRKQKTRELGTRDLTEAIALKHQFEQELKAQNYQTTTAHRVQKGSKPILLVECMALFVAYLNNVDVEPHMARKRSDEYLWSVEDYFEKFCLALKHHEVSHAIFRIDELNDRVVAFYHKYILEELKHSNKTYNKMMALMRQFVSWLIDQKGYAISNPFTHVQRRVENRDNTIVTKKEFTTLLNAITPEDTYHTLPTGERKNRYKPWLSHCFRLALETGLRREEFMCIQFSDIVYDDEDKPLFVTVENYKVNRIRGGSDMSRDMKSIPITKGLLVLLQELGIKEYRGNDRFLIGNEESASRNTLIDFVSRAFTYYWERTGIQKKVQLKHLRKTYLTALVEHFGDKAPMLSDHSGIQVLKDHYVNNERLVSASRDFEIFKN